MSIICQSVNQIIFQQPLRTNNQPNPYFMQMQNVNDFWLWCSVCLVGAMSVRQLYHFCLFSVNTSCKNRSPILASSLCVNTYFLAAEWNHHSLVRYQRHSEQPRASHIREQPGRVSNIHSIFALFHTKFVFPYVSLVVDNPFLVGIVS